MDGLCVLCGPLRLCVEYSLQHWEYSTQRRKGPQSTQRSRIRRRQERLNRRNEMHARRLTGVVQILLMVLLVALPGASGKTSKGVPPPPVSSGPFPVGVMTTVFVDKSRTDSFTKQPRTLVTAISYQATDDARRMPANRYSDFIPGGVTPEIDQLI